MDPLFLIIGFWALMALAALFLLCVPIYCGLYLSVYLSVKPVAGAVHPAAGKLWDSSWVLKAYQQLMAYHKAHPLVDSLWLYAPPAAGGLFGLLLLWLFYRHLRRMFSVDDL